MDFLEKLLLVLHFVGLASLLGGFLVQIRASTRVVNSAMFHGVLTQLVTGVLLVGVLQADDDPVNNAKVGVKLLIALVIAVIIIVNRKRPSISTGVWGTIGGLTLANVVIAVFW